MTEVLSASSRGSSRWGIGAQQCPDQCGLAPDVGIIEDLLQLARILVRRRSGAQDGLQKQPPSYLFEALKARLLNAPMIFNLVLELTGPDDPTNDPNAPWPADRQRIRIGQLEIVRTTTVEEIGDAVMMHDPTWLTDGIEQTDDPVLAARRGVYEVSVAYRTGGSKGRLAALERASHPFSRGAAL